MAFAAADEAEKDDDDSEDAVYGEDAGDETIGDSEFVDLTTLFPDYPDKREFIEQGGFWDRVSVQCWLFVWLPTSHTMSDSGVVLQGSRRESSSMCCAASPTLGTRATT